VTDTSADPTATATEKRVAASTVGIPSTTPSANPAQGGVGDLHPDERHAPQDHEERQHRTAHPEQSARHQGALDEAIGQEVAHRLPCCERVGAASSVPGGAWSCGVGKA